MSDDATSGVGAFLREARERAGFSVRAISDRTKIPVQTLEALERDDVSRLPGGIFLRSFIRSYAREVGLDPEEAVRRFVTRFPDASVEETPTPYISNPEKIVVDDQPAAGRLWRIVGWSLPLVLVIVYFGFGGSLTRWRKSAPPPPAARAETQAEPSSTAPAPVLTTPVAPPSPAPTTAGAAGEGATPAVPATGAPAGAPVAEPPARAGEAPKPAETAGAAPAAGQFQVTLSSRGRCWVMVRSDAKIVYAGTMNPGERQDLTVGGQVSVTVGNAAVIDVALNGKPARPLGGEGEVVTWRLNVENLNTFLVSR